MASRTGRIGFGGKLLRLVLGVTLALFLGIASLIGVWRFAPPISTLMVARWVMGERVDRRYVPLEAISPDLRLAVVVSEDARFCRHEGVDWDAMWDVIGKAEAGNPSRGASTITMQTVKNLFLWPSRSYLRKAIEVPLALALDAAWPKRRVLEVYLNIAEWGEGIFGAEAAARQAFGKSAARLSPMEAALLATALPNPLRRNASRPASYHRLFARRILARMRGAGNLLDECLQ